MIQFTPEKILLLHRFLIEETGGLDGLRDEGLFDSAVQSAFATFGGKELFPTKEEKAAKICHALVSNHAFLDGNKRIGVYVMLTFLDVNGIKIDFSDDDLIHLGLGIADGTIDYMGILNWIHSHKIEL